MAQDNKKLSHDLSALKKKLAESEHLKKLLQIEFEEAKTSRQSLDK